MREEMDETKAPEERENGDLTLKMESLLVHGNGESAVVLVIDSNHSSLQKRTQRKPFRPRDTSFALSLFLYVPLPHSLMHIRREREKRKGVGNNGWSKGEKKKERENGTRRKGRDIKKKRERGRRCKLRKEDRERERGNCSTFCNYYRTDQRKTMRLLTLSCLVHYYNRFWYIIITL